MAFLVIGRTCSATSAFARRCPSFRRCWSRQTSRAD